MKTPDQAFDALCETWRKTKLAEAEAKAERAEAEVQLLEYVEHVTAGTKHASSDRFHATVRFDTDVDETANDFSVLWDQLPEDARPFLLIPSYSFSKQGYNQAIKTLGFMATANPEYREKLQAVKDAAASIKMKNCRPYFEIKHKDRA